HLEYSFNVAVQDQQTSKVAGLNSPQPANVAGNLVAPETGSGTMFVDVLSVASDGALVVRISELAQNETRPRQAYTCNVYGSTSVFCPSAATPSAAEWLLLSYLGRQFIDAAPWDAQGHWQRKEQSAAFDSEDNFTLVDAGDGKKVIVREIRTMQLHDGPFDTQTSDITINYDRTMEVPTVIHADVATAGGDETNSASYVFTLEKDSFAKSKP
ncbi:MAG: hypothetical protein WAK11_08655, partial [Candidatus Cybelea sp.]